MMAPALIVIASAVAAYTAMVIVVTIFRPPFLFWPSSAVYWFLALCFLVAFGAIYKSISLRVLADLLDRPGRQDEYQAISSRYVKHESFHDRVRILVTDGLAVPSENGLVLTEKGRRMAVVVSSLQRLFKIERSG